MNTGGLCPAAAAAAAAAFIAEGKTIEEIELIAAVFVQIGETLETIAAARNCEAAAKENNCGSSHSSL